MTVTLRDSLKTIENYKKVLCEGVKECLKTKASSEADKNYCAIYADSEDYCFKSVFFKLLGLITGFNSIFFFGIFFLVLFPGILNNSGFI